MIRVWRFEDKHLNQSDRIEDALTVSPTVSSLVWMDVTDDVPNLRSILENQFAFHPLAVDDSLHPVQRPKLEEFGDLVFLVAYETELIDGEKSEDGLRQDQVAVFMRGSLIVTVHAGQVQALDQVANDCANRPDLFKKGPAFLLYLILDRLVDGLFPLLDRLDDRIDQVEDGVLDGTNTNTLDELFLIKRLLLRLRRVAGPTRDVINMLLSHRHVLIDESMLPYYRDVSDHVLRVYELLDGQRELVSGALDAYLSTVNNRLSLVMQRLTIITVIFLPLTFVTGLFGMNLKVSPWIANWDHGQFFWGMLIGMALFAGVLMVWFRRKRLL